MLNEQIEAPSFPDSTDASSFGMREKNGGQHQAVVGVPSENETLASDKPLTALMPESMYPTGPTLAIQVFGLCLAVFCVALDNTIIATAIPRITDDFKALQDVGWYGSGMKQ